MTRSAEGRGREERGEHHAAKRTESSRTERRRLAPAGGAEGRTFPRLRVARVRSASYIERMGWRERDWARWTDGERARFYGESLHRGSDSLSAPTYDFGDDAPPTADRASVRRGFLLHQVERPLLTVAIAVVFGFILLWLSGDDVVRQLVPR